MAEYQYTSKDISGNVFGGVIEAENLEGFYQILKGRSQFCLSVKEAGTQSRALYLGSPKIKLKDLSIFSRQFSTMLSAGLPVIKCLDILYEQTVNKRMKAVILSIYEAVQRGDALSTAMRSQKGAFPLLMINMVEAGEASGTLDTVMKRLANQYEKDSKTQNRVQQALIYPAFISCLTIAVVIFLLTFIMPKFINLFREFGGKLPPVTRALLAISNAITGYWYLFVAVIILLVLVWNLLLKSYSVRLGWDRLNLHLPVIGKTLLIIEAASFSRTLASLFSSGLPVIRSIEIVARVIKNRSIKESLYQVNEDVKRGVSISSSVKRQGVFPPMLVSMLNVGEESGNMDEILNKTAAFYDEESETAIQKMISIIEPLMIVILAFIVGFIIISIITPIFSLYSQINASANGGA